MQLERTNIAQRLYRITGAGIYADSLLVGQAAPLAKPLLDGGVLGQDSAINAIYRGRLYWFWGDTNRADYPLGNFQTSGATSALPGHGGLDPDRGIDLTYFTRGDGFVRRVAPIPGQGPTWIDGLVTLEDHSGEERLVCAYAKIRGQLAAYERGLAMFDPQRERFEKIVAFPADAPFHPAGQPFRKTVDGKDYIYFATPYPLLRVPADLDALKDLSRYEGFTCLKAGSRPRQRELDRAADGSLRYAWKRNTAPSASGSKPRSSPTDGSSRRKPYCNFKTPRAGNPCLPTRAPSVGIRIGTAGS